MIVSTWRDITKLKQNFQRQLIQSEEKFRLLAQHSIDWEYWFEKEGGFHYVSPACETVTGYTPEEFYRDKHLLQKIIHPDDFIKWKQHHALEFEQKPRDLIEFRILTKNQQLKYIEHRCTFIISDVGDFSGIRVSNRDISLRKAKEEEIKKLEELLSICSHCKKIRDEEGVWHQMEEYMSRRKNLSFSHGICKECMVKYYPEYL